MTIKTANGGFDPLFSPAGVVSYRCPIMFGKGKRDGICFAGGLLRKTGPL